jgi:hypothetical protein
MGNAVIFNGCSVKALKRHLKLGDGASVISGTDDPTIVAKDAKKGSLYLQDTGSVGRAFIKQDEGSTTNWLHIILNETEELTWNIGDGTNVILSGTKGRRLINRDMTVTGWRLCESSTTPIAGSISIDLKVGADYNTAVSITGTEKPTLTSQDNNSDLSLSTWTVALNAGDFLWFNIDSVVSVKKVILTLEVEKA